MAMKLFIVDYMDDCDDDSYLTVGESLEEVQKREEEKLYEECACLMYCYVREIREVDGYEVSVKGKITSTKRQIREEIQGKC